MSEYRGAEPIKLGILVDVIPPGGLPPGPRNDFLQVFEFVIDEGLEQGLVDRQVEVLYREAAGLPRGTVKAVIDVYAELVDAGCLAVFGPMVTENAIPLRKEIERRFRVPALSLCGADEWLGKWTFALPNGSMTDEPIIWADLMAKAGQTSVGVLYETSLIGQSYLKHFRRACHQAAIRVVAEEPIAQTGQEITDAVRKLHNAQPAAVVHCGFGYGVASINEALETLDWNPPVTPARRSRARTSPQNYGRRTSDGSDSSSSTRTILWVAASLIASKHATADGPSTTGRWSSAMQR